MIKIELPILKLDFNKKKKTSIILFLAIVIVSILFYFNSSILINLIRDSRSLKDNKIESNQKSIAPPKTTRSTRSSDTRKLNPSVSMYKKEADDYGYNRYSGGRLIQMTTEEDPVLSTWVSDYTGLIKIFIYKIDEKALLEYLTYDSDGNQTNAKMDMSSYQEVGNLEVESAGRESFDQVFPIEEPGIYFIRSEFSEGKLNDCILVRSPYSSVVKEGNGEYIFWTQGVKDMKKVKGGLVTLYKLLDKPESLGNYHTNADGITKAKLKEDADIAVIKNDEYYSVVPINLRNLNTGYTRSYGHFQFDTVVPRYFTFVDRPIYKPGDTVYFKSIVRNDFDAEYSIPNGYVEVEVSQYGDEEPVYKDSLKISPDGTVSASFKLPETVKTGTYYLSIYFPDLAGNTNRTYYYRYSRNVTFQVEYYRKPEYFIEVNSDQTKIISGDKAKFTISGNYFSGQPLADKKITYDVYVSDSYEGYYYYPGDWSYTDDYGYGQYYYYDGVKIVKEAEVTLNKNGKADVEVDFSEYKSVTKEDGYNKKITLVAKYQDLSMNTTTRTKSILISNGDYSIFKDSTHEGHHSSADIELPIILVPSGNTTVSNINLTAKVTKETWVGYYPEGESYRTYKLEKEELPSVTKTTNNEGKVVFSFPKISEGAYRVVIEGTDNRGNEITKEFYVGRYYYCSENAQEPLDGFDVSSDKEIYYPSDSLVLNIDSRIPERDVLVTVERGHVRRYQVLHIKDSKAALTLPVLETDIPNIYISVSGFSKNSFISKKIGVTVSTDSKKLFVSVTPDKEKYKPGDEVILNVHTTDYKGNPVSANLAVWAMDKALFEIAYENLENVFDRFWFDRYNDTETSHSLIGIGGEAVEMGGGGGGEGLSRDDFEDTAYWNANVNTDSNGMAKLSFKLPDNLTTWVISAIGSNLQTMVGNSVDEITVSKDVILRPFLPNILREGDTINLSSTVNNFTKESRQFDVSLAFDSGDIITDNYSKLSIEPGSSEIFSWNILPKKIGDQAKLTFTAISDTNNNDFNDSVVQTIPIREYGFNQKNCTVGENEVSYPVNFSEKINKDKSYLEVSLATGLLGTIPDSVKYLLDYPYGCIEQTTSRFVPLVIAKKNPTFFGTTIKNKNIDDMIVKGLRLLESHQQSDGGWVWWSREGGSSPFITAYVLEYILEAQELGFKIDSDALNSVKYYIANLYSDPSYTGKKDTKKQEEEVIKSYAKALLREGDYIEINNFEGMTPDILSIAIMADYLGGYFDSANTGLEKLKSMAKEQGSGVYWEPGNKSNFGSIDASTAFAIRAISTAKGDLDYAIRGARYLVNNRKNYYWSNTFATAQIIRAIIDFSEYSEESNPTYSYTVRLDDKVVKAGTINSPNQLIENITIPVDDVSKDGSMLTIKKEGKGQLYSTVCINEFINDREATETGNGISVKREYLDDNGNKYRKMAVGDIVTVKITVNSREKGVYGVISDELPSGLIPINTSLKNSSSYNTPSSYYNSSLDITENGAVFYANNLNIINVFQYKAQVISEGTFYVPPATASLMYDSEIFGRSNSEVVVVDKDYSVVLPSEKTSNRVHNNLQTFNKYDIDKSKDIKEENTQERVDAVASLVALILTLLLIFGILQLLRKNVTPVQIKDWVLGYINLISKNLLSLLTKKITRDKS